EGTRSKTGVGAALGRLAHDPAGAIAERITQEHYQEIIRHVREHKHGATAEIFGTPGLDSVEVRK
ncbi:MAG TPA: hypothetical protein VME86_02655, partial [Acidobacteriaceae bacterium]|nr:hypothetical protein [Acidobacteriaceae bacterium]